LPEWIEQSLLDAKKWRRNRINLTSPAERARSTVFVMETLEQIKNRAELARPARRSRSSLILVHRSNLDAAGQRARGAVAQFLRDHPALALDYCSNVTGVDWLDRVVKKT